jgi:[protein-PII] uridylyltransferase
MPSEESVRTFANSLPESYRKNFDLGMVSQHMRIALERESAPASVGTFLSNRGSGDSVCVVAEDRPGLLATISAALVLSGLDVIEAEAYTRRVKDHVDEAVDIFWVRHEAPELRHQRVSREKIADLQRTLIGLLEGKLERRRISEHGRPPRTPGSSETVVRFIENAEGNFGTLEVETGDRSGLLLALSQALFNQRVQIVGSQVKTVGNRVFDRFNIVELDGHAITPARRLEIQVAVLTAVDPVIERAQASVVP